MKVYSPNATWSRVKSATIGASVVIYFGHGNGWPSPYTYDPEYTTKNGFGLNASAGNGDNNNKYYGEPYVSTLDLAPNAIVMLHHLCYAAGNSEPGDAEPTKSVAKQRADNYGAGFLKAGAKAVIADGHRGPVDYLRSLFTTDQTLIDLWRTQPNYQGNEYSFASVRTPGKTVFQDPETRDVRLLSLVRRRHDDHDPDVLGGAVAAPPRLPGPERLQRPVGLDARRLDPVDLRRADHQRLLRHPLLPGRAGDPRPDGELPGRGRWTCRRRRRTTSATTTARCTRRTSTGSPRPASPVAASRTSSVATQSVSRAQMAGFLLRALDLAPATKDYFTDDDERDAGVLDQRPGRGRHHRWLRQRPVLPPERGLARADGRLPPARLQAD